MSAEETILRPRDPRDATADEALGRALVATVPAAILRMDVDGRWTQLNDAFRTLWHLPDDVDPALVDWPAGLHPDDRERVQRDWRRAMAGSGSFEGEFRILAPDGTARWAWTRALAEHDEAGRRIGFTATTFDVEERHRLTEALTRSERLHRLTVSSVPGVLIGLYDRDLRCVLMEGEGTTEALNTAVCAGRTLAEFGNRETAELLGPGMEAALLGAEQTYAYRSPRDGSFRENHVGPLRDADGTIEGVIIVSRDVTRLREEEDARRAADEQFRIAFEHAPIGIGTITLDGRLTRVNQALCAMTGYAAEELVGMAPEDLVHPDDVPAVLAEVRALGEDEDATALDHRVRHAAGHAVWVDTRIALVRDEHGEPAHLLAQVQDISERRSYERSLEHLADHDPLTGLLNRRGLERELEAQLDRCRRHEDAGTLLVLDLDGFKYVNDSLGHAAGDEVIVGVAGLLRGRLRTTDVVARLGGDEFAVLLASGSTADGERVGALLLEAIRDHGAEVTRGHRPFTASVGLAAVHGALTADELLVQADLAMYDAKEAGKDRVACHRAEAHGDVTVRAQMTWVQRIERALDEDRLVLHAQPICDLRTRAVVRHEVLLRMVDDDGGLVAPGTFLGIAERFGLAPRLDAWVIEHALEAMAGAGRRGRRLPLSVNVSATSAGDPLITAQIERGLRTGDVDPGDLMLELTETAAVGDIPRARAFAETLSTLGCTFALDDFGAGFGSFTYVKQLPFDVLKLDGEYVRHAATSHVDRSIIAAVSGLARSLGKQTVAEFVGDDATVDLLVDLDVHLGQGFHLGRPHPLADLQDARDLPVA